MSAGRAYISGATAPRDLLNKSKRNKEASTSWYFLGLVVAFFTTVNYGFTSAAYARKNFDTSEEQWAYGAYYVSCAVLANVFFDLMAAREDIGKPLEDFYAESIKPFFALSKREQAKTTAQLMLAAIIAYCSFNTSFTTKIPGQEGIAAFSDVLPSALSTTFQVMNDIYAGIFVTGLFTSGTFQLPKLIWDALVWKKDQACLEKSLLLPTLAVGLVVGMGAYLVFMNTLWNFPENKVNFEDPFNDYLKGVVSAWQGFAAIFPLTRGAFCILFAQRGAMQLLLQLYALCKTALTELPLRLGILLFTGVIAYGSIGPSIFQAATPQPHQIGDQNTLKSLIIACAFFVNALGVAKRLHNFFEKSDESNPDVDASSSELSEEEGVMSAINDPLLPPSEGKVVNAKKGCCLTPLKDILHKPAPAMPGLGALAPQL